MALAKRPNMSRPIPIRHAATIIVLRDADTSPAVLMGQRGANAAFMPGKFVFPGGAMNTADADIPVHPIAAPCADRLADRTDVPPHAITVAALRELWEETGQILGHAAIWNDPPDGWQGFAAKGYIPNAAALTFWFRAITPSGEPRRFDARFFLADAADLCTDPDDFSGAEDELSHLQWISLKDARSFDLPFITQVVLAEVIANLPHLGPPKNVPFFENNDELHLVRQLGGAGPL